MAYLRLKEGALCAPSFALRRLGCGASAKSASARGRNAKNALPYGQKLRKSVICRAFETRNCRCQKQGFEKPQVEALRNTRSVRDVAEKHCENADFRNFCPHRTKFLASASQLAVAGSVWEND